MSDILLINGIENKLKTLNDLKTDSADLFCEAVSYDILKQLTIKWVKKWEKELKHTISEIHKSYLVGKIEATMEINNITKDDLK